MPSSDSSLTPRRWLGLTLGLVGGTVAICCAANYGINYYGLYGNVAGRVYRVASHDERATKYLFSMNYIPANFDGLLIGSSVTDNWNTDEFTAAHVYNDSFGGGNITEAKAVADNVMARRRLRVAIFLEFPYLTETSGFRDGAMVPRVRRESLGSLRLFANYAELAATQIGIEHLQTMPGGAWRFHGDAANTPRWEAGRKIRSDFVFAMDPAAWQQYSELVNEARSNGALIVRLRPLIYLDFIRDSQAEFTEYYRRMDALFRPSDPLIDFTAPEYESMQANRANFMDGVHLTWETATRLVREMNAKLLAMLAGSPE